MTSTVLLPRPTSRRGSRTFCCSWVQRSSRHRPPYGYDTWLQRGSLRRRTAASLPCSLITAHWSWEREGAADLYRSAPIQRARAELRILARALGLVLATFEEREISGEQHGD